MVTLPANGKTLGRFGPACFRNAVTDSLSVRLQPPAQNAADKQTAARISGKERRITNSSRGAFDQDSSSGFGLAGTRRVRPAHRRGIEIPWMALAAAWARRYLRASGALRWVPGVQVPANVKR